MKIRHLSENEIQLHLTENSKLSQEFLSHLGNCPACQAELNAYKIISTDIKTLKRPAFDFDLSELVLDQIPVKTSEFPWATYFVVILGIILMVISFATFSDYLVHVFKALPSTLLIMVGISALLILLFQSTEAVKIYREKINSIKID
jgi:hypothetical protein